MLTADTVLSCAGDGFAADPKCSIQKTFDKAEKLFLCQTAESLILGISRTKRIGLELVRQDTIRSIVEDVGVQIFEPADTSDSFTFAPRR